MTELDRPASTGARRLVLLLNNPFVSDSRSWKIARSLAAAGWSVTVVARRAEGLAEREERGGFVVVRVEQPRPLAWLPSPRLPEADRGTPSTVPPPPRPSRLRATVSAVVGRPVQAVRYLLLARQWADRIGRVVPDADVWQAEGLITLPVALALRERHGGRVVYDVRDLQVESSRFARLPGAWRRLLAQRERRWAQAADGVLAANQPYADVLVKTLGVRPVVIYNGPVGVRTDAPNTTYDVATSTAAGREPPWSPIPVRERLGLARTTRIVLCLGNVAPGRGVEQLCRAIADVPDAALLVVGPGGAFRDQLAAEAADLPAADRIHFLPAVPPDEIPAWTAAADVAAMAIQPTTLNHRLTTPTRLFDAMGVGVPVVASDLPGMASIVTGAGCGVVCDPTDPAAIAAALRDVLDGPPERRLAFREAALAAAGGRYAWERQVERLLQIYARLEPAGESVIDAGSPD
jgi:glycosyltransferase involved in cell wall biosynthesis